MGNEPGWYLEVDRTGDLLYVGNYGATALRIAQPSDHSEGSVRVLADTGGAQQLRVEILEGSCTDSMSGAVFPYQVIVRLQEMLDEAPDAFGQMIRDFVKENEDELFDSREECVAWAERNFDALVEGAEDRFL